MFSDFFSTLISLQNHIYLEPQNVNLFGNEDVIN